MQACPFKETERDPTHPFDMGTLVTELGPSTQEVLGGEQVGEWRNIPFEMLSNVNDLELRNGYTTW